MIVKVHKEKYVNDYSMIELTPNYDVKMYVGALRSEYNNRYFRKKKNASVIAKILDDKDRANIKANVEYNIKHSHYDVSLKEGNLMTRLIVPQSVNIDSNFAIYKTSKYEFNFELSNHNLPDGIYEAAQVMQVSGKFYLIVDRRSFKKRELKKSIIKSYKKAAIDRVLRILEERKCIKTSKGDLDLMLPVLRKTAIKSNNRVYADYQSSLFKVILELHEKYDNVKSKAVVEFKRSIAIPTDNENQIVYGKYILSTRVRELLIDDYKGFCSEDILYSVLGYEQIDI